MKKEQRIFDMRKRAIPSHGIQDKSEKQSSQMNIGNLRAPQRENETENQEKNPEQMDDEDDVSKQTGHGSNTR